MTTDGGNYVCLQWNDDTTHTNPSIDDGIIIDNIIKNNIIKNNIIINDNGTTKLNSSSNDSENSNDKQQTPVHTH